MAGEDTSATQAPTVTDSPAPDPAPADPAPAEETSTTPDPAPAPDAPAETPKAPEPTGPAPDTNDPTLPDHGVDPDKGIDPDAGDQPPNPDEPNPADPNKDQPADNAPDLKNMSRAERAEYFRNLDQATRKKVEASIDQAYQPQPMDELTEHFKEQGHSDFEAQILARETRRDQQAQINEARAEIAELNAGLTTDAMEVVSTIDWLNPTKGEGIYDKSSADAASALYQELCIVRDENTAQRDAEGKPIPGTGQIIETKMMPSRFYHLMDQIRSAGSETSRLQALKSAEKQMAAVAPPSSNTNRRATPFESKSAAEMRAELQAKGVAVT